jgi:hypothetical protein
MIAWHGKSESGFVLVIVISLFSVIGILGAAYAGYSYYLVRRTAMLRDNAQAYYAARAGLSRAMEEIASGKTEGNGEFYLETMGADTALGSLKLHILYEYLPSSSSGGIRINSYGRLENSSGIQCERILVLMTNPALAHSAPAWVEDGTADTNKSVR